MARESQVAPAGAGMCCRVDWTMFLLCLSSAPLFFLSLLLQSLYIILDMSLVENGLDMYAIRVVLKVPTRSKRYTQLAMRQVLLFQYVQHMYVLIRTSALIGMVSYPLSTYVVAHDYGAGTVNSRDS